jgi:GNAT superfamily N-acetyltransferase
MELHPAGPDDANALAEMRYAFRSELDTPSEPHEDFVQRMARWFVDRAGDEHWKAWIARDDTGDVGTVFVQLVEKLPNPVPEPETLGYITSLWVAPHARGQGIGEALLDVAVDFCRQQEVDTIILWPSQRSVTLYQRRSFRRPAEVMELALVDHAGRRRTGP